MAELSLLLVQAEEISGAGGAAEDESSIDGNLEVRNPIANNYLLCVHVQLKASWMLT